MSGPLRIWLELAHHPAFRVGAWAFVKLEAGELTGWVGGERYIEAERTSLAALGAALAKIAPGAAVELFTTSPLLLDIPGRIAKAQAGDNAPAENLDLWAQAATGLGRGKIDIRKAANAPRTPTAFAIAWADQAYTRTKDRGAFTAAIPKPNLAKAGAQGA